MQAVNLQRIDRKVLIGLGLLVACLSFPTAVQADGTIQQILKYKPKHFDGDYDVPTDEQIPQCKVNVIRQAPTSGYMVVGPQGQVIRRFMDTNGDTRVDTYSYYFNGLEVYRDIDTNGNNKYDQARWLNTGGSRWGIDSDEDGHIDSWKTISPEEVSQVVVQAFVRRDVDLLKSLLVTKADLTQLGVTGGVDAKILDGLEDLNGHFRKVSTTFPAFMGPRTKWLQFNGSSPSVIPSESLGLREDLFVYENSMAVVDLSGGRGDGNANTGLVQLGELVRIGNVWKLTGLPLPNGGDKAQVMTTGLLMQAGANSSPKEAPLQDTGNPQVQQLVTKLQAVDKQVPPPNASREDVVQYYRSRLKILDELVKATSGEPKVQEQWIRQIADFLASGIQSDAYPQGASALKNWEAYAKKAQPGSPLEAHITYRRMLGDYTVEMKNANNDARQGIQDRWLKEFEAFYNGHQQSEEGTDAAWLIAAHILEFNNKQDLAQKWYQKLVAANFQSQATDRAKGALRRLTLANKTLDLSGPSTQGQQIDVQDFRGKIVLVVFWATWCEPCTADLPQIKKLYDDYHDKGFEVIGINLDTQPQLIAPYLQKHAVPWQSIWQEGGLESPLARQFGIVSLPTMFLVDGKSKDGKNKVINQNAAVVDVKKTLTDAFK